MDLFGVTEAALSVCSILDSYSHRSRHRVKGVDVSPGNMTNTADVSWRTWIASSELMCFIFAKVACCSPPCLNMVTTDLGNDMRSPIAASSTLYSCPSRAAEEPLQVTSTFSVCTFCLTARGKDTYSICVCTCKKHSMAKGSVIYTLQGKTQVKPRSSS